MTVREYLSLPGKLKEEIRRDIDNVAAMRSIVENTTMHLSFTAGRNPSKNNDTFENVMLEIAEEEKKIEEKKQKLIKVQVELLREIGKLKDKEQQDVLRMRYIEDKKMSKIADVKDVTIQRVYQIHGEAVENLEKALTWL